VEERGAQGTSAGGGGGGGGPGAGGGRGGALGAAGVAAHTRGPSTLGARCSYSLPPLARWGLLLRAFDLARTRSQWLAERVAGHASRLVTPRQPREARRTAGWAPKRGTRAGPRPRKGPWRTGRQVRARRRRAGASRRGGGGGGGRAPCAATRRSPPPGPRAPRRPSLLRPLRGVLRRQARRQVVQGHDRGRRAARPRCGGAARGGTLAAVGGGGGRGGGGGGGAGGGGPAARQGCTTSASPVARGAA
jgi:translation initiation factor IF-2